MLGLIFAANQSFLVLCAVKLDVVEHLFENPMDAKQLALVTNTQPNLLHRFLRSLCSLNILEENKNGQFCVTKLGSTLKSGTPNCIKNNLKLYVDQNPQPMMFLDHTLRTGETAFDSIFKMPYFEYISKNEEIAKVFADAMAEQAISFKSNVFLSEYDYSVFNHIIDVGGGKGHSLLSILHKTPNVRGTVFELEACIEKANEEIKLNGLEKRCVTVTGNFFDSVPEGGDCYILQNILHDWNDTKATKILVNT
ncbi:O-methyltransferase-like protein, partial [Leptotrombidium deliense]